MGLLVSKGPPDYRLVHKQRHSAPHTDQTSRKVVFEDERDQTNVERLHQIDSEHHSDSDYPRGSECTSRTFDTFSSNSSNLERPVPRKTQFRNPETLKVESMRICNGPRASENHLFPRSSFFEEMDSQTLVSKLGNPRETTQNKHDIRQCIITSKIPRLEHAANFEEVSSFLKSNDEVVCKRVQESLVQFLLSCGDDQEIKEILAVEENVWRNLRQKQDHVFDLGLIDLMLWSYLLCHLDVPKKYEDEIIVTSEERRKSIQDYRRETQSTASSDLFKAMLSFHEDFPKRFAKRGGLSLGKDVQSTCQKRDEETHNLVKRAKFCDKFAHLYSLLKQIMTSEYGCENIIAYLDFIFPSLVGNGSCAKTQTLTMLLAKGCIYLLQTVFNEADVQIGPVEETMKKNLTNLILRCVGNQTKKSSFLSVLSCLKIAKYKRCQENRLHYILWESSSLIFHLSKCVRDAFFTLINKYEQGSLHQVYVEEIERRQANCGLKILSEAKETDTFFQTLIGRFGNTKVIVHAHTPSYEMLHNAHAEHQVSPDKRQEWDQHINNLDLLRKMPKHPNIVELFAFQVKPFPWYYIIEDCQQMTLQKLVLQRRESNRWVSDYQLCLYLIDIVHGLSALHDQNIVLRDLTLSNFFLAGDVLKIGDLSRACIYKTESNIPVKDLHPGDIPTRWSSPEALLDGSFSPKSDIWSLGLTIYVLFTHGCDPYTEYYNSETEAVMRMVVFEDLAPFHWSCIPNDLYTLMKRCMKKDPLSRIELTVFEEELDKCMTKLNEPLNETQENNRNSTTTFEETHLRDMFYPIVDSRQQSRHHLPERGIPPFIHKFRKEKSENFEHSSRRDWIFTAPVVTREELQAQSDIVIGHTEDSTVVKEPMTELFIRKRLPHVEAANIKSSTATSTSLLNHGSNHFIQERTYEPSSTLLRVALRRSLDSPYEQREDLPLNRYLHLALQVAQSVQDMHKKDLIHRDLRAKNFLVNLNTQKVYTCRIGRIFPVPATGIVQDRVFKDSSRWLPPEVLIDGIYSKPGDVYMLAMMFYELLEAYQTDDERKEILCVPYCMVHSGKLSTIKQKGEFVPQPEVCPDWLYNFLVKCWNPDRCERPDINTFVSLLQERLHFEIQEHAERLRKTTLSTSPARTRQEDQGPVNTYNRQHPKRIGKFKKTMNKLFGRSNVVPQVARQRNGGNARSVSSHIYASVNQAFISDEYTPLNDPFIHVARERPNDTTPSAMEQTSYRTRSTGVSKGLEGVKFRTNRGRKKIKRRSTLHIVNQSSSSSTVNLVRDQRKKRKGTTRSPGWASTQHHHSFRVTNSRERSMSIPPQSREEVFTPGTLMGAEGFTASEKRKGSDRNTSPGIGVEGFTFSSNKDLKSTFDGTLHHVDSTAVQVTTGYTDNTGVSDVKINSLAQNQHPFLQTTSCEANTERRMATARTSRIRRSVVNNSSDGEHMTDENHYPLQNCEEVSTPGSVLRAEGSTTSGNRKEFTFSSNEDLVLKFNGNIHPVDRSVVTERQAETGDAYDTTVDNANTYSLAFREQNQHTSVHSSYFEAETDPRIPTARSSRIRNSVVNYSSEREFAPDENHNNLQVPQNEEEENEAQHRPKFPLMPKYYNNDIFKLPER